MPRKEESKEILGLNRITKKRILELCKKDKLYQTPELNDVLYLHYQGFESIECLEDYTELKCLWLECNAISEIQGLEKLAKLKCLFLQSNLIRKIENLEFCKELDTINLSQNHIRKIENCGFEVLPVLNTLNLSSNYLKDCDGLKELENCKNLSVLDLSNNRIDDILVVKIFSRMPELKVLVLQGNPVVSKIPQYRKTLILECKKLTYLDSRPVFPKDRACAEAWKRGGYEEERRENERWNRKERKKMRDGVNATIQLRNKHRKLEDQISLIPSSESEDDLNTQKKPLQTPTVSDVSTDSIWDEVSEDIASERSEKKFDGEMVSSMRDKKANFRDTENEEMETLKDNAKCLNSSISCENNLKKSPKADSNEKDLKSDLIQNEGKCLEIQEEKERKLEIINENRNVDGNNSHDSEDLNSKEKYEYVVEAIENISKSQNCPSKEVQLYIENVTTEEESVDDNYEPLKEMDKQMEIFKEPFSIQNTIKIKTLPDIKKDNETLKLNEQVKTDLEELSNNMSDFVKQLGEDQEVRQEVIKSLFIKNVTASENNCESSESDWNEGLEKFKINRVDDLWNKESHIKRGIMKDSEIILNNKCNNETNKTMEEIMDKEIATNQPYENILKKDVTKVSTNDNSKYIPIDISLLTRQSNDALDSLERESNHLKKLLQELENKNEELFKVDKNENSEETYTDKDIEENTVEQENKERLLRDNVYNEQVEIQDYTLSKDTNKGNIENLRTQDQDEVVQPIIERILQSLENDSSEYYDEVVLPTSNTQSLKQITSESVPEFLESFNNILKNVETKTLPKDKENLVNVQNKSAILKELAMQPNLKQFNKDTHENLDAQLEKIKRDQHTKVRRMVDRVYAQKDRYNDTLELVDGKLMVRNQNTNELHELSQIRQYESSDSEDDYETADDTDLSENEAKGNEVSIKYQGNPKKKYQNKHSSFKPSARKSCEDVVLKALRENNQTRSNDVGDDESNDEFYSLDNVDTSNLYNIDTELFNKLKLDNVNLSQNDENHIAQCARSYEELKHYLTTEEKNLKEEENELLENMCENKSNRNEEDNLKSLEDTENDIEELNLTLKSSEKAIPLYEYKYDRNNENNSGKELADSDENILHGNDENLMKKILLKELSDKRENRLHQTDDKQIHETVAVNNRLSEKEKNEIENNIDFESADVNEKIRSQEKRETTKDLFKEDDKGGTKPQITINDSESNNTFGDVEILECNLEIIEVNNEIVDSITVNAEVQF